MGHGRFKTSVRGDGKGQGHDDSRVTCYRCGEKGHTSPYCSKGKQDNDSEVTCFNCKQLGHFKRDLPKLINHNRTTSDNHSGNGNNKDGNKDGKPKTKPVKFISHATAPVNQSMTQILRKIYNKTYHVQ